MGLGIIHFHSCFSFDSMTSIRRIANFVRDENLDFAVLTDHDSIEGSLQLRKQLEVMGSKAQVPIAAEYRTSAGDVIVMGIERDIRNRDIGSFIAEVRSQGGVLMLPHPYEGHKDVESLARAVDVIEVFNGRCDEVKNAKSLELASRVNKPVYWSSDAHLFSSLRNVIVEAPDAIPIVSSIKDGKISPVRLDYSSRSDLYRSQLIKAVKRRNPVLFLSVVQAVVRESLSAKITR